MTTDRISIPVTGREEITPSAQSALPVKNNLRGIIIFSLLIALLTFGVILVSLLFPQEVYPTEALRQDFLANDVVTLFIGLPILVLSLWLARRGKLVGLLFWPGALFFGLYNYLVYLFGMPFHWVFPFYLLIVTLSIYTTIALVASLDSDQIKQRLTGRVPVRLAGGILVGLALFIFLFALGSMIGALIGGSTPTRPELGLHIADFITGAAWLLGGVLLWRQQALGFVSALGLLFQGSMLFIGLLAVFILQPFLTSAPFALVDFIFIFVIGSVCFIPFALYMRGVLKLNNDL